MVEVRIRHDDHMVFGTAKALHPLAVRAAAPVDVFGNWRGADEANGLDHIVVDDRVNRFFVAVHDLQDAFWQACLFHQFGQHQRHGRVAFRRFEDKGVAAGDGGREHPHRDHGGEVERGDARADAKGLLHGIHVDAGTCAVGEVTFQQLGRADAVFHNFEAALHVACGIWQGFAVLARQGLGQLVHVVVQKAHKFHHHTRAALWVDGSPCGLCGFGGFYSDVHFGGICKGDAGLHVACGGVIDVGKAA